jgi:hypothetical protein
MLFYLDVGIALAFVYFFLSLFCSVIIEGVAAWTRKRPCMLFAAITKLLGDDEAVNNLYKNPLFLGSSPEENKRRNESPSYIPSRSFVLALLESLKKHTKVIDEMKKLGKDPATLNIRDNTRELLEALPQDNIIRQALVPLLDCAKNDFDKAFESMEKWYDDAMERVTGWYKRWSQYLVLILAFFVALILNADTFHIGTRIYQDQTIREGLVAAAGEVVKSRAAAPQTPTPTTPAAPPTAAPTAPATPQVPAGGTPTKNQPPSASSPATVQRPTSSEPPGSQKKAADIEIIKTYAPKLPLGWPEPSLSSMLAGVREDPSKLLGFLVTAILVSLGSTFWFELLTKLINLRNAGKKPPTREEMDAQKGKT